MADEQRIAVLERHVRALYEQLAALRTELRAGEGGPRAAAPRVEPAAQPEMAAAAPPVLDTAPAAASTPDRLDPPPPRAAPAPRRDLNPDIDLEKLLGRYGTIAVASLAILMGVGTFLSWAIEHGHLGPTVRVILGFIGAGIVAGVGLWVRKNRDMRFGNVLLALSLAIVHVDAWAAGPHLQVLSTVAALAIAATASAALAALALTSEERTLFAIGFAGALLAPFITAREPGSIVLLLTYGWVVIAICLFAIREKGWRPLLWLTVIGAALYVAAAEAAGPGADHSWLAAHSPVIFALACAASGLLFARDSLRSKLALAFLMLACFATIVYSMGVNRIEVSVSLVGTIAAYLIARELETDARWLVIGNVVLPLGFLFATVASTSDRTATALAAAALTAVAAVLAWEDEEERSHHLFVTAISSGVAIVLYLSDFDTRCIAALALDAALFSMILRSTRTRLLAPPIMIGLLIASVWSYFLLEKRGLYAYTPFLTIESLCALAVVLSWAIFAFALKPTPEEKSPEHAQLSGLVGSLAIIAAFMWVRQELVDAWSHDAAMFALIIYYALAGLALIFAGRFRRVGLWRAAGLALAFYAGYKALVETFTIDAVGLRVGARILVGVFLAAVAYWYRVPQGPPADITSTVTPPAGTEAAAEPL
ncbi:MAG TPA: DUF2339 domain-containing protein [Gemmatimonadaceae bacterium]|nr:DUF2339 domain-containing protein [Gemmatimonadaceae bacterium]